MEKEHKSVWQRIDNTDQYKCSGCDAIITISQFDPKIIDEMVKEKNDRR